MNLLALRRDVLLPILELLTQRDATQLARVNRAAHNLAMPSVLSRVSLGQRDDAAYWNPNAAIQRVTSFTSLVLKDADVCGHHIKSLTLHCVIFSQRGLEHLPLLEEAMRCLTNLRELAIARTGTTLKHFPALVEVVAGYEKLEYLKLQDVDAHTTPLLARMTSRPREIFLEDVDHPFVFDCLRPHSGTLEVFRLVSSRGALPPPNGDAWDRVHTLELSNWRVYPPVASLSHAFPHVLLLSIQATRFGRSPTEPASSQPFVWQSIDILELHRTSLNLVSPARVLRVGDLDGDDQLTPNFLHYAQPVVLGLDVYSEDYWMPALLEPSGRGLQRLQYLSITRVNGMIFSGEDHKFYNRTSGGYDRRRSIIDTLGKLAGLQVPLRAISFGPQDALPTSMESMASFVAGLFPTIEFVGFGHYEYRRFLPVFVPSKWYRVGRARSEEDGLIAQAVNPVETARITRYLEELGRSPSQ
ncbi:hypothetical protein L226DRAFT_557913 [Lentinus tigrinus ALCF2SS1-7]|uniref:F-box domain-containing protein n=1 Tax=Lentinus tigrinus ALCF2SS1-6 TaxID=1328759 RepID=A0A5C2SPQ0_9APHY|nr:hypothetical protein L227DRAFT_649452 [Lentinus tigrinus ALCF2SS1-6]RPD79276.1 hypothetical protein L226DRAFT_557913 [Lentinus tigrinus ALCF2SS1-7]